MWHRLVLCIGVTAACPVSARAAEPDLFRRDNLVAWCIVPFDAKKRGPEARVEMLERLGFKKYAYDWRTEHLPTFDEELRLLKAHQIELTAVWFPTELNADAKTLLSLIEKHQLKTQLWVTGAGGPTNTPDEHRARVQAEAKRIRPIAEAAGHIGCTVGLYNHGGWFGEPENQLAILAELKLPNVGLVYNQHHGHDHLDRFAALLAKMKPHLCALNLNGMVPDGERIGQKIVPLGAGSLDLKLLKIIRESGYTGPIGILGHTQDDAEERLRDNLDGLDWLLRQREGKAAEPLPKYRTFTPPKPPDKVSQVTKPAKNHWGKEEVGFDWTEQDSVDSRWSQTQVGPFLASLLPLPGLPMVEKGLSIKLGEGTICYDTEHCSWRAAWTGGFLKFDPARYGLIGPPKIDGDLFLVAGKGAGWRGDGDTTVRHRGIRICGDRIVLETMAGQTLIREIPGASATLSGVVFTRDIEIAAGAPALRLRVCPVHSPHRVADGNTIVITRGKQQLAVTTNEERGLRWRVDESRKELLLEIAADAQPRRFRVNLWDTTDATLARSQAEVAQLAMVDWSTLDQPARARWTEPIVTQGKRSSDTAAYVIDTLTIPFENPYRALFFVSGFDVLPNGDLAVCTAHGDVWTVRGVDERLERLEWRRFATGLFQPLGLKVVDGRIHVLGRDQITILHDDNGDGEVDRYENFCNIYETSSSGHDYVTCLETDSHGAFYFLHAKQGLVRVSPDGRNMETIATGFRNPNGMGIGPNDVLSVSPQEGEWTPASSISEVRVGGHYGYLGPKPSPARPLGYDPPLCWIPRAVDNSSGGQVWSGANWGPLSETMLHLSFGQCRALPVLRETVDGVTQGAVVASPLVFESGVMRGRVNPHDGNVYVGGLRGWVTSAVQDGCLQRIRYTGLPAGLPVGWKTHANGLSVRFSEPVDAAATEDSDNYRVQRWDYRYGEHYGSPEYQDVSRGIEGRANVEVLSATRSADGRTVFLELRDVRPAMQYAVTGNIARADGGRLPFALYPTIHRVPTDRVPEQQITRRARPDQPTPEQIAQMRPGVRMQLIQFGRTDARVNRLAALYVPQTEAPSLRLSPGPFNATLAGWIQVPSRDRYSFRVQGNGKARLTIKDREVWLGEGRLDDVAAAEIELSSGYHPFYVLYNSPMDDAATLRLMWSSESFAEEPVPSTALWHDSDFPALQTAQAWREGHWLYRARNCANCHGGVDALISGPELTNLGNRVTPEWTIAWLQNPRALRHDAAMPRLIADDANGRQAAADVARFLVARMTSAKTSVADAPGSPVRDALRSEDSASRLTGEVLWEDLGCIGCHRFTPAAAHDDFARVSLSAVNAKFHPGELVAFLQRPQQHWPTIRMPDFQLSPAESLALAEWIAARSTTKLSLPVEWRTADAERGRKLVVQLQCQRCHRIGENQAPASPIAIAAKDRGCLAESVAAGGRIPAFDLTAEQRGTLRSFLTSDSTKASHVAAEETAWLTQRLNCRGCHHRDHDLSPRGELIADESDRGLPPEAWPNLTWAGAKLRGEWLRPFLAGEQSERPRPWLKGRMPAFPAYAEALTRGLLAEHGWGAVSGTLPRVPDTFPEDVKKRPGQSELSRTQIETGRKLTLALGGLDCRQCHGIAGDLPAGDERTRLARGVDFLVMRDRLREEHFLRFALDPPRFDIATRMPKLAADGRTTKITSVYDGDARRQFEAIWEYVRSLPR